MSKVSPIPTRKASEQIAEKIIESEFEAYFEARCGEPRNIDCRDCGRTFNTESDQAGEDGMCIYCTELIELKDLIEEFEND